MVSEKPLCTGIIEMRCRMEKSINDILEDMTITEIEKKITEMEPLLNNATVGFWQYYKEIADIEALSKDF